MVETAILLIPFFAIFFAIIDYAQIYFYDNSLQNAMREATRFGTAGRIIPPLTGALYETNQGVVLPRALNDNEGREASRNTCIRYWFQSNCVLQVPLTNISIYSAPSVGTEMPQTTTNNGVLQLVSGYTSNLVNGQPVITPVPAVAGPGNAGDYLEVTAVYKINTITPFPTWFGGFNRSGMKGGFRLRVSAIVKNEPGLLNFQHTNIYADEASTMVQQ